MSASVTPIRTTMSNTYGQTMSLHFAEFSTALRGAPFAALLERSFPFGRKARTSVSSPPPAPRAPLASSSSPASSSFAPSPASSLPIHARVESGREMTFTRTDNSSVECVVRIEGALDVHTAPEIRAVFDEIVAAGRHVVLIDLSALTTLDSSGVGAIVSLFKRVKTNGGRVIVRGVKNQPLAICKLLKLDRVFGLS